MIFRKPYGFLIKHFRIIHIILMLLFCYIIYKTKGFLDFFNLYINSGYSTNLTNFAKTYFNFFTFILFAITLSSLIAILFLMLSKKKSCKFYIISVIYYAILLIAAILAYSVLLELQQTSVEANVIRAYRDIFNILYYPQFIFIVFTLLRGIGFDIKNFNFNKDLEDLDLLEEDEEEVELNIDLEGYKAKRKARRTIRELKYYVLENRFVFTCIAVVAALVAVGSLILNFQVYNKRYKLNQSFIFDTFQISYKDSILTNRDYQGKIINENKYYLATILHIKNTTNTPRQLDTDELKLVVGNEIIYPFLDRSGKFADIAIPYYGNSISGNNEGDYVIVYELTPEQLKTSYTIKILSAVELDEKELIPKYKIIKLKPTIKTKVEDHGTINIQEKLDLSATTLNQSSFTLNNYDITNKYEYSYEFCYLDDCYLSKDLLILDPQQYYNQTLLVLDADLDIDNTTFYSTDRSMKHNFYTDFITINYTLNGKEYNANGIDITPLRVKDKVILRTTADIARAEKVSLKVGFRDQTYTIKLK